MNKLPFRNTYCLQADNTDIRLGVRVDGVEIWEDKKVVKKMTQKDRVRMYLDAGKKLTRLNAWDELGILECPERLSELRQDGYPVVTTRKTVTNRYGEKVSIAVWSKG